MLCMPVSHRYGNAGTNLLQVQRFREASKLLCHTPCTGNHTAMCGGSHYLQLYAIPQV